jgi:hypothetical protein
MIDQEKEDLGALLTHPGWLRLVQHIDAEWGPAKMESHYETAANNPDQAAAATHILQIAQRKRAVRDILDWPAERLKQIKAREDEPRAGHVEDGLLMDLPPLRLLGDRILIKPLANDTQTASGLILMEHRKPETMGEVIAVGTCAHPLKAHRSRHRERPSTVGGLLPGRGHSRGSRECGLFNRCARRA